MANQITSGNIMLSVDYEYGPFGEVIRVTGDMARLNPFQFSAKFDDNSTGFIYYGSQSSG